MNVLIIGASGLLGAQLYKDISTLYNVCGTYCENKIDGLLYLDICDKARIKDVFMMTKPELVFMPASLTNVDLCEQKKDLAWKINVEGAKDVAICCKRDHSFFIYYSTDYVFDGRLGPYAEGDQTHPINFYGETKLEAEIIVSKELCYYLIIRPCGIYGFKENGKNFAMQLIYKLQQGKQASAAVDQYYTPVYVNDLSRYSIQLFENKKTGLYHIAGPTFLNRVEFSHQLAEVFGFDKSFIKKVCFSKLNLPARRPMKAGLKIHKIAKEISASPLSPKEAFIHIKKQLNIKKGIYK